ncbi:DUF5106 domain-containing protein [Elizabethkingia meningoseptica]|uniref:DUF5106 domain-containing protein n=1 Tax=Elizabethkingia meningoseptica TaxID=238 RepID=UPI0023AE6DF5|nr:DUF5106 domain-containing protein [Elizabethkingia meningoseptica]MDE5471717.1 DUF5106 domain-containing protein [Elizabethkingia meningoseptica]MDE5518590.1 DUF5106 domain-containing protein [Elizabethkingia meningoseptica]
MRLGPNCSSVFYFSLLLFFSCAKQKDKPDLNNQEIKENIVDQSAKTQDRSINNYWDNYNFSDTEAIKNRAVSEQALVDFIALFPNADKEQVSKSIKAMLEKASVNREVFDFFKDQYEKYLYNANSPLRNDVYYVPVLEYLVSTPHLNDTEKIRYKMLLELVDKNMPGSVATNFEFVDVSGTNQSLHKVKGLNKLLIFYDPECSHCAQTIQEMKQDSRISTLVDNGKLQVIAICPVGELNVWQAYQKNIPNKWINGFDKKGDVTRKRLYDIKAFPTIFLIDGNNKVVLKDVDLVKVLNKL